MLLNTRESISDLCFTAAVPCSVRDESPDTPPSQRASLVASPSSSESVTHTLFRVAAPPPRGVLPRCYARGSAKVGESRCLASDSPLRSASLDRTSLLACFCSLGMDAVCRCDRARLSRGLPLPRESHPRPASPGDRSGESDLFSHSRHSISLEVRLSLECRWPAACSEELCQSPDFLVGTCLEISQLLAQRSPLLTTCLLPGETGDSAPGTRHRASHGSLSGAHLDQTG